MKRIITQLIYFINAIHFIYCRHLANKKHRITGKRYFVIPRNKCIFMIVANDEIKEYNRAAGKLYYKRLNIYDMLKECHYMTSVGPMNKKPKHV